MTQRVACIGEAMIELSMTNPPAVGIAGDTLNTAIYLKRAAPHLQVDYITRLGQDPFSDQIRDFIASHDIGTLQIETSQDRIPGLYAITTQDGERSFTYWRDQAAAREMFQTPDGPDFSVLLGYDLLYLSAITLAILPAEIRSALLVFIKANGLRLAFDSNYRPRLWPNVETAQTAIGAWWDQADLVMPSIDDEMALMGETAQQVTDRFCGLNKRGALKRGPEGPLPLGSETVNAQTYPAADRVIDTTAAGDSFNGGYLASVLMGEPQAKALMAGHVCAARVVGFPGAIVPPEA